MHRFRRLLIVPALVCCTVAHAQLWNNGPLVTHPGGGFGGADESRLQNSSLGMTFLGFGHQVGVLNNWLADDFTVDGGGWDIEGISFFAYQTNSTTTSTMTDLRLRIFDAAPNAGGNLVFGDTVTNRLSSTGFANIYRASELTIGSEIRPIMQNDAVFNLHLDPGTYWLAWQTGGSLTSGPWAPPVTITGQSTTGNALQYIGGANLWQDALDPGTSTPQDFPFVISGTPVVPEPGTMIVLGIGAAAVLSRRRRKFN